MNEWPILLIIMKVLIIIQLQYINESILNEKLIKYISTSFYGAIFILDGVSEQTISSLISSVKCQ